MESTVFHLKNPRVVKVVWFSVTTLGAGLSLTRIFSSGRILGKQLLPRLQQSSRPSKRLLLQLRLLRPSQLLQLHQSPQHLLTQALLHLRLLHPAHRHPPRLMRAFWEAGISRATMRPTFLTTRITATTGSSFLEIRTISLSVTVATAFAPRLSPRTPKSRRPHPLPLP